MGINVNLTAYYIFVNTCYNTPLRLRGSDPVISGVSNGFGLRNTTQKPRWRGAVLVLLLFPDARFVIGLYDSRAALMFSAMRATTGTVTELPICLYR